MEFAKKMRVRVTFVDEALGTLPNDKEIYSNYIASNSPDAKTIEEEVAAVGVEEYEEKQMTVFPRTDDGKPFIYDYQWKGFFKEAASAHNRIKTSKTSKVKAFKKIIDTAIFVEAPIDTNIKNVLEKKKKVRQTILTLPDGGEIGKCQRPLRASTAQGERISLACSETIPAGTTCEFYICMMDKSYEEIIREWLDYAEYHGTLQWRNASKGRFLWEELDDSGKVIGGNAMIA